MQVFTCTEIAIIMMNGFQMLILMYAAARLYDSTQMLSFAMPADVVTGVLEAHLHAELLS